MSPIYVKTQRYWRNTFGAYQKLSQWPYQRVILNDRSSSWKEITAGVPQESVLGPLFFLIYINDLCDDLSCNVKLFADDTSLFTLVFNENISAQNLNNDLRMIQERAFLWKMQFNPDLSKQAVQVIFSPKKVNPNRSRMKY